MQPKKPSRLLDEVVKQRAIWDIADPLRDPGGYVAENPVGTVFQALQGGQAITPIPSVPGILAGSSIANLARICTALVR